LRPIRKARAHALDHSFESREQFLPLFVESAIVPQRDYHFEAFDDFFRVLVELFCFIKHFAHPRFSLRGRRLSGCLLVSHDHPYCDFKIKIIKWLIALFGTGRDVRAWPYSAAWPSGLVAARRALRCDCAAVAR
jgi:hypothetical protein